MGLPPFISFGKLTRILSGSKSELWDPAELGRELPVAEDMPTVVDMTEACMCRSGELFAPHFLMLPFTDCTDCSGPRLSPASSSELPSAPTPPESDGPVLLKPRPGGTMGILGTETWTLFLLGLCWLICLVLGSLSSLKM